MASVLLSTGNTVIDGTRILGTDVVSDNLSLYSHMILEAITKAKNKLDTTGGKAREPGEFLRTRASLAGKIHRELASSALL